MNIMSATARFLSETPVCLRQDYGNTEKGALNPRVASA